jgi:hypothetical protein
MYKIETLINGNWAEDAVGEPNEFDTEQDAQDMIPVLARIFNCPVSEFRAREQS